MIGLLIFCTPFVIIGAVMWFLVWLDGDYCGPGTTRAMATLDTSIDTQRRRWFR